MARIPFNVGNTGNQLVAGLNHNFIEVYNGTTLNVKQFGAVGDYNPDTDVGTDDTIAFQNAFNAITSNQWLLIPEGIYKITDELESGTHLNMYGPGLIWCAINDMAKSLLKLNHGTGMAACNIDNITILGPGTCAKNAITAWGLAYSQINVSIRGGFENLFYVYRIASGNLGPEGGAIQCSNIRILSTDIAGLPFSIPLGIPVNGIWNRGWANSVRFYVDFSTLSGSGLILDGTYSDSFGVCEITGSIQGSAGNPIIFLGSSVLVHIHDLYTEGVLSPTINAEGLRSSIIENMYGDVTLKGTCSFITLRNVIGHVDIDPACLHVHVHTVSADSNPVRNKSITSIFSEHQHLFITGGIRFYSGFSAAPGGNVILNGDFKRWVTATVGGGPQIQPYNFSKGECVITKCGVGCIDTTKTSFSDYCIKIEKLLGFGFFVGSYMFRPGELEAYVGLFLYVNFKLKIIQGEAYAEICPLGDPNRAWGFQDMPYYGIDVENGFQMFTITERITASMGTLGAEFRIHIPTVGGIDGIAYLSEVQGGIGFNAPSIFMEPNLQTLNSKYQIINGSFIGCSANAPVAGGDFLLDDEWQIGDRIYNTNPAPGSYVGWICTQAGSPGIWKGFGLIESP